MVLLWALSVLVAYVLGSFMADMTVRHYWRTYGYCPACNRLDCAREHS